jgi:hypothetical protein
MSGRYLRRPGLDSIPMPRSLLEAEAAVKMRVNERSRARAAEQRELRKKVAARVASVDELNWALSTRRFPRH